jgi:polyhydroxybutyrate depolymerase
MLLCAWSERPSAEEGTVIDSHPLARLVSVAVFGFLIVGVAPNIGRACDRDTDCQIGDRSYRIILPEDSDGATPIPAIIFVHGYRGTAAGVMGNDGLTAMAEKLGFAFVAAQAAGAEWNIPNIPSVDALVGVDELAYFDALSDDLARRFAIERSSVIVAGFSSGAMMVWHLACNRGDSYAGFVPMSGTFWEPLPMTCPTIPGNLIHYHGREDPVVPLGGRQIKDAHQGDLRQAIALVAGLSDYAPVPPVQEGGAECSRQVDGKHRLLELCLFTGRHEMKAAHLARAIGAMEESGFHQ